MIEKKNKNGEVSDEELKKVIGDFLEMGHVENIAAMFRHDTTYYSWTGDLLNDERFNVRLGLSVLFEDLQQSHPDKTPLAIPSLVELLTDESPMLRGEATSILGIIGTEKARAHIEKMATDPDPQVREVAQLILEDQ